MRTHFHTIFTVINHHYRKCNCNCDRNIKSAIIQSRSLERDLRMSNRIETIVSEQIAHTSIPKQSLILFSRRHPLHYSCTSPGAAPFHRPLFLTGAVSRPRVRRYPGTVRNNSWQEADYSENTLVGYRWYDALPGRTPVFPFGHGLSYTSWGYTGISVVGNVSTFSTATVTFVLQNTGKLAGSEVAQLYVHRYPDLTLPAKPVSPAALPLSVAAAMPTARCVLVRQCGESGCVRGETFGCAADGTSMWVTGGCRGDFTCGASPGSISCNILQPGRHTCPCLSTGPKVLVGFQKTPLKPGAHTAVSWTLAFDTFRHWDSTAGNWTTPTGVYGVFIGSSSRDIRLTAHVNVT